LELDIVCLHCMSPFATPRYPVLATISPWFIVMLIYWLWQTVCAWKFVFGSIARPLVNDVGHLAKSDNYRLSSWGVWIVGVKYFGLLGFRSMVNFLIPC